MQYEIYHKKDDPEESMQTLTMSISKLKNNVQF